MKRFLKANKGVEIIEIIFLFPFVMFLILYSAVSLFAFTTGAMTQETTNSYIRSFVTHETLKDGLEGIINSKEYNESVKIVKINIVNVQGDSLNAVKSEASLVFNSVDDENVFTSLFTKDAKTGYYSYNPDNRIILEEDFAAANLQYKKGAYVEIFTEKSISKILSKMIKIKVIGLSGKLEDLDYGVSGILGASGKNVIIG